MSKGDDLVRPASTEVPSKLSSRGVRSPRAINKTTSGVRRILNQRPEEPRQTEGVETVVPNDSNGIKMQQEALEWARGNVLWILGLLPVAVAVYKVVVISNGDTVTLLALLRSTSPVDLLLTTIISTFPVLIFWTGVWLWEWRRRQSEELRKKTAGVVPLALAVVALPVLSALQISLLAIYCLGLAFHYGRLRRKIRKGDGSWTDYRLVVTYIISLTILNAVVSTTITWMPTEVVKVKNREPVVAYVVSSDPRWFVYMEKERHQVVTVSAVDVESRVNCMAVTRWYFKSVSSNLSAQAKGNAQCPG